MVLKMAWNLHCIQGFFREYLPWNKKHGSIMMHFATFFVTTLKKMIL